MLPRGTFLYLEYGQGTSDGCDPYEADAASVGADGSAYAVDEESGEFAVYSREGCPDSRAHLLLGNYDRYNPEPVTAVPFTLPYAEPPRAEIVSVAADGSVAVRFTTADRAAGTFWVRPGQGWEYREVSPWQRCGRKVASASFTNYGLFERARVQTNGWDCPAD